MPAAPASWARRQIAFFHLSWCHHHQIGKLVHNDYNLRHLVRLICRSIRFHLTLLFIKSFHITDIDIPQTSDNVFVISATAQFRAPAAFFGSVTTGIIRCGIPLYTLNSTTFGSTMISLHFVRMMLYIKYS